MDTFGKWLIEQREAKGLSQNKFAVKMKFSQAAVSRVEADKVEASASFLNAVAAVLDLPIEEVYRRANILPAIPEADEWVERTTKQMQKLPSDYRAAIDAFLGALRKLEEKEMRKK